MTIDEMEPLEGFLWVLLAGPGTLILVAAFGISVGLLVTSILNRNK